MYILVFKTSVTRHKDIEPLRACLNPMGKWSFDLDDCDRILRLEVLETQPIEVIRLMEKLGYSCVELE